MMVKMVGVVHHGKVKSASSLLVAHTAGAYPGFCSIKRLGVFLLPPGWDANPSQGYPLALFCRYPFREAL